MAVTTHYNLCQTYKSITLHSLANFFLPMVLKSYVTNSVTLYVDDKKLFKTNIINVSGRNNLTFILIIFKLGYYKKFISSRIQYNLYFTPTLTHISASPQDTFVWRFTALKFPCQNSFLLASLTAFTYNLLLKTSCI